MKRHNNLFEKIISTDNLRLADKNARRGKLSQPCVQRHILNAEPNILSIHESLKNKTFRTSKYTTFTIKEPKERLIFRLPYNPDRIVQWAIMNVARPVFVSTFTYDTYSCIKGRGIHLAVEKMKQSVKDPINGIYFLKIDIKKFYESINNETLKTMMRRKFKDNDFLELIDGIIDSAKGLPIGNYMSQYLANFYLCYFDHWIKETMGVVHYFRYADDMVFLSGCKKFLHRLLANIRVYLSEKLHLTVKKNYRVAPVACGIDFLGYVFRKFYTLISKTIKQGCAKMLVQNPNAPSINGYMGWFGHANTINLTNKLIYGHS